MDSALNAGPQFGSNIFPLMNPTHTSTSRNFKTFAFSFFFQCPRLFGLPEHPSSNRPLYIRGASSQRLGPIPRAFVPRRTLYLPRPRTVSGPSRTEPSGTSLAGLAFVSTNRRPWATTRTRNRFYILCISCRIPRLSGLSFLFSFLHLTFDNSIG